MRVLIVLAIILIIGVITSMATLQATDCVITKDNPYKDMPMVCKYVLVDPSGK